jgi:tetratricopeptide (TPR) repeat protein
MLAGLPVILFTSYVQRAMQRAYTTTPVFTPGGSPSPHGTFASLAAKASPHVSWRRTWMGGAVALGMFAALVVGFMVFRALGIGPAGSLMAAGKLGESETVVVADFRGPPGDSTLGSTVAEALRTDLRQSSTLSVMTRASVSEVLRLMQRGPDAAVDFNTAREVATREGARAVLDGEIVRLGQSYVVSARLVSAFDGAELATFSERADDENQLIHSLGRLSRDIRSRIGESLKDIRQAKPLERVSTPSLAALRKYVEGVRQSDELGNVERGLALFEEAVTIDTAFAMAWRKIAVVVGNLGSDRQRQMDAAARAFRHRERLSETERLLTEAYYYSSGPEPSRARALAAYEALLESDPMNTTALNNAGVQYMETREWTKAAESYRRALDEKRPFGSAFTNLMLAQLRLGQVAALESTQMQFRARVPNNEAMWMGEWMVCWAHGRIDDADSVARATYASTSQEGERSFAAAFLSQTAYLRGKLREGDRWLEESRRAIARVSPALERALVTAIDSARDAAFFLQDTDRARTLISRALARHPIAAIPAASRPWNQLGQLAAILRDPALAREARDGFERDLPALGSPTPAGSRARMNAWVAMASSQYAAALKALRDADREMAIDERRAMVAMADAFDLMGEPDSAIVYFEQFVRTPDSFPLENGAYVAGVHKRLGELYDARADTGRAEAHYQFFLDMWKDADPELQPKVRAVRARMAQLRQRKG